MKYKKIVLVNPFPKEARGINEATVYPPLGLAYIASFLKKRGIVVKIIDANILKKENKAVIEEIKRIDPDIVGISINIITAQSGTELSRLIKKKLDIFVCLGGPYATSNPEEILKFSFADVAVLGEGERVVYEICRGNDLVKIKSIAFSPKRGRLVLNKQKNLIRNLDALPFPAFELLPPFSIYKTRARRKPVGCIITSRGCPFQCAFCNTNIFGKRFRARSPENVIGEIDLLVKKFRIKQLDILDDNFALDIDRAEKILDLIIKKKFDILINLQNGVRTDNLSRLIVKKMKKAGVFKVGIGVESGNVNILKSIKKSLNLKKVMRAIQWFREEGIITVAFFIIGFPNETKGSIRETINFAIKTNPSLANFSLLIPFPGTEIFRFLEKKKMLKKNYKLGVKTGFFGNKIYHRCLNISEKDVIYYRNKANRDFYLRISKLLEILCDVRSLWELKWLVESATNII
jgi:radical SAM superfamily enzyme YgiQ (UPF0313 family)